MKGCLLISAFFLVHGFGLQSQSVPSFEYLDLNNLRVLITNIGVRNFNVTTGNGPACEFPKDYDTINPRHASFFNGLWIGGRDPQRNIRTAIANYNFQNRDFYTGPLTLDSAITTNEIMNQFNRTWKINRQEVDNFNYYWQQGIYYQPESFLTYPGNGPDGYADQLAPYFDNNNDGIYNSLDGDYPIIKGDQQVFSIFNDNGGLHHASGSYPLGIEIHHSAWVVKCDSVFGTYTDARNAVNNTVFHSFKIINRSSVAYDSVYVGNFDDPDIGNYRDDYVGTWPSGNFIYTVNADNFDEGNSGYGENPPMRSLVFLNGPQPYPNDGKDNNNNGMIDEPRERCLLTNSICTNGDKSITGDPFEPQHAYNWLRSRWKDYTYLTDTGSGYGFSLRNPYAFMWDGEPYSANEWNMWGISAEPADYRMLASSGPFQLVPGQVIEFELAEVYSWYRDAPNGIETSWQLNLDYVNQIRDYYNGGEIPSCSSYSAGIEHIEEHSGIELYPNPTNGSFTIRWQGNGGEAAYIQLYNHLGQVILLKQLAQVSGTNTYELDLTDLHAGMYHLIFSNGPLKESKTIIKL